MCVAKKQFNLARPWNQCLGSSIDCQYFKKKIQHFSKCRYVVCWNFREKDNGCLTKAIYHVRRISNGPNIITKRDIVI